VRSGIGVALVQPKMFVEVILCEMRDAATGWLFGDVTVVAALRIFFTFNLRIGFN